MADVNGRNPQVGDLAAKLRIGTITGFAQAPNTVVVQWQDGTTDNVPASCLNTIPSSPMPDTSTWPWICIGKMCGQ